MHWLKRIFGRSKNVEKHPVLQEKAEEAPNKELTVTDLVDAVVLGMEELNKRFPEMTVREDLRGEPQIIDPRFLRGMLLRTYEMAITLKGTLRDRQKLQELGESEVMISTPELQAAPSEFYAQLAINLRACVLDLKEAGLDSLPVLREAYTTARKANGTHTYETTYDLGLVFTDAAEDLLIIPEEKREALRTAISYFNDAVRMGGDNMDYYCLGEAQADLAELSGPQEAQALRTQAIKNLRKSYELDGDTETLEWVKELENPFSSSDDFSHCL